MECRFLTNCQKLGSLEFVNFIFPKLFQCISRAIPFQFFGLEHMAHENISYYIF